ncbi:Cytochrome P450 [Popillia japonica]|uniref:Cytochrome P450 n=1 Tax=Popillia japonica TaxID=7064 RepID=A0AAW1MFT1_POPJA
MFYIEAVAVIAALWFLFSYYKWRRDIYYPLEKLPGDPRYPIIGTQYIFIGVSRNDLIKVFIGKLKKFAPLFRSWNGSIPEIHLMKPEHIEIIMSSSNHITKGRHYNDLHCWLGQGLLTSGGQRWVQHRKLITPTFHFKILENYMNVFVEKTGILLDILDKKTDVFVEKTGILLDILDKKTDGKMHNIYSDITHCAVDIICESAMGVNVGAMLNEDNEYVKAVYEFIQLIVWKALHPYQPTFIFNLTPTGRTVKKDLKILHDFSKKVISDRKALLKQEQQSGSSKHNDGEDLFGIKRRLSFLDLLIEASEDEASEDGKLLNDSDIRQEVDTFMFEGHDTTAASISWILLLLGNHPDIQDRVFEEIRAVICDKSTPTSISELHELKYLERVIKEALRLYPSVPFVIRKTKEDIHIEFQQGLIRTYVWIYLVHRDPEIYPDPEKFDPDRFLPENSVNRHPYAYIPFSAGPRNCVGQKFALYEEKTILASIINRYKITAVKKMEDILIHIELILRPANGVLVKLERRL